MSFNITALQIELWLCAVDIAILASFINIVKSFNQFEASIFPMQAIFPWDFPFLYNELV